MIKRVIFDIDSTLLESEKDWMNAYQKHIENSSFKFSVIDLYIALDKFDHTELEFNLENMAKFLSEELNEEISVSDIVKINESISNEATLISSKTNEVLEYLKGKYELYSLTNWLTKCQVKRLEKVKIDSYFEKIYGIDTLGRKPDVEVFRKICEPYNYNECVMIGDSFRNDIEVPDKLGMKTYYLSNEEKEGYKTIKSIDDLMEIL